MEQNPKIERILEKIRKLMDLKESALQCGNAGEANAAAAGVTRLLLEYDLTLADIPSESKPLDPIAVEKIDFNFSYMQHGWYFDLVNTVAEYNNGKAFRTRTYQKVNGRRKYTEITYSLVGRKKNREVILYLISFLANAFIRIGRNQYRQYRLRYIQTTGMEPPTLAVYMKSFLAGCVGGLLVKFEEERRSMQDDKVQALVVSTGKELDRFMHNYCPNMTYAREGNRMTDKMAMSDGYDTGRNISINKGVGTTAGQTNFLS